MVCFFSKDKDALYYLYSFFKIICLTLASPAYKHGNQSSESLNPKLVLSLLASPYPLMLSSQALTCSSENYILLGNDLSHTVSLFEHCRPIFRQLNYPAFCLFNIFDVSSSAKPRKNDHHPSMLFNLFLILLK